MKTLSKIACLMLVSVTAPAINAQNSAAERFYNDFKKGAQQTYDDFRYKANRQYLECLGKEWDKTKAEEPAEIKHKEKVPPTKAPENLNKEESNMLKCDLLDYTNAYYEQPQPLAEVIGDDDIMQPQVNFSLYGTPCAIRYSESQKFQLPNLTSGAVRDAWAGFLNAEYDNTLRDCLNLRQDLNLCDWGYKHMLSTFAEEIYGPTSEAQLLTAFLYSQSGYDMRLVVFNNKLLMTYASDCNLQKTNVTIGGKVYYSDERFVGSGSICAASFPQEQPMSLKIGKQPTLNPNPAAPKMRASTNISTMVSVDVNLLTFYNTYPIATDKSGDIMWQWMNYAMVPMHNDIKRQIYPTLQSALEGLTEEEAVDHLLEYIYNGFTYKEDPMVWGQERTFFAEETLYYPYCDCEDRAILFSRLVRDLVDLDVALVYYPGHLATAVKFNGDVNGDYIMVKDEKYVVCDPTYIGAGIGRTIPGKDNSRARAIVLSKES